VKINTYDSIYELQTKLIAFTTVFMCTNMVAHLPEISSQNWRRPPSYYMGQLLRTWFGRVNYLISNQIIIIIIIIIIIDVWNITHQCREKVMDGKQFLCPNIFLLLFWRKGIGSGFSFSCKIKHARKKLHMIAMY